MYIFPVVFTIILIGVDQITKYLAVTYLQPVGSVMLLTGVLDLSFVQNKGAAFGIMEGGRWFFVILTTLILAFILAYYRKLPRHKPYNWVRFSLILITSGAIGNFIDRLLYGRVTDFFHVRFINFPVFNVADIYVVVGTFLLALLMLFFIKDDGGKQDKEFAGSKSEIDSTPE